MLTFLFFFIIFSEKYLGTFSIAILRTNVNKKSSKKLDIMRVRNMWLYHVS